MVLVLITDTYKVFLIGSALAHVYFVVAADAELEEMLPVQTHVFVLSDSEIFKIDNLERFLSHRHQKLLFVWAELMSTLT